MEAVWGCVFNDDLGGLHGGGDIRWRPFIDGLLIEDIRIQVRGRGLHWGISNVPSGVEGHCLFCNLLETQVLGSGEGALLPRLAGGVVLPASGLGLA